MKWIERLFVVAAAVCLAYVYATWKEATFYQIRAKREIAQMAAARELPADRRAPPVIDLPPRDEALIGLLDIPRLALSVAVLEGDDDRALSLGAGHLPNTPLPWDEGNSAVAGHRDTFFRPLRHLRLGDEMELTTAHGTFSYRVREVLIVNPSDVWVLAPSLQNTLTLITCYPFNYVGLAPQRYIVRAERNEADVEMMDRPLLPPTPPATALYDEE